MRGTVHFSKRGSSSVKNVSYDDMVKFILNNVEYTYNVSTCLHGFISSMDESGCKEDTFFMTENQEHFCITKHFKILNQNTDDEKILYTYDVRKL